MESAVDELASLVQSLGLSLVKVVEFLVPAASALEDVAAVIGWLFVLVVGLLVVTCIAGLTRR